MGERRAGPRVTAAMCAHGRVLGEPRLAPDGGHVAYVTTSQGRAAVAVIPAGGGPESVLTSDPAPPAAASYGGGIFDWMPNGDGLVFAGTDGGLWRVPIGGGPALAVVDPHPVGPAGAPAVAPDGTRVAYVVDQHHVAVAPIDPADGWPVRLPSDADFCFDPAWAPAGDRVAWHEWDVPAMAWDSSRIVVAEATVGGKATVVAGGGDDLPDAVSTGQPRFSPDGARLGFVSDDGGWLNLWAAASDGADPQPLLSEEIEHGFPTWGLGQRSFAWSPDGTHIAFTRNRNGFLGLSVLDVSSGAVRDVADGFHAALSWAGDRLAALYSRPDEPTRIVVYDGDDLADRRTLCVGPVAGWERLDLPAPEAVTWPADDGTPVNGRLYRPRRSATGAEPPPMLVWIHGGPTSQWPVGFNARFSFFVERGWAVLVPDHRGSTGFGRAYTQAMFEGWGVVDVADTAAGMRAAAERGWADGRRMVPIGGSAGGFTVLNLLAHHPGLCAAGVDLFGVADLFDLDETTHRFEKHYLHTMIGPLPQAADAYRERSPSNVADVIEAPLLVLQGDADKVVPPAQSEAIADKLRSRGGVVELHVYEGEAHGWNRPETVIDELGRIDDFLRRHVLRWRS
ncbi:MAG: S9 family peptidase [Acidimicrobiales bacterium]